MYKITFGLLDGGNRGIEFASRVNATIIKGLWGHPGTKVTAIGSDDEGHDLYHLTDNRIRINPLLVTCELLGEQWDEEI